jgi:hypothetical protein
MHDGSSSVHVPCGADVCRGVFRLNLLFWSCVNVAAEQTCDHVGHIPLQLS